jgi:hypothetical protein
MKTTKLLAAAVFPNEIKWTFPHTFLSGEDSHIFNTPKATVACCN